MPAFEQTSLYGSCYIIATVRLRGEQPQQVRGVAGAAAMGRETHISIQVGRVVLYLEDRAALAAVRRAVGRAEEIGDRVFGPLADEFTLAEARARADFEKGRRAKP